MVSRPFWIKHVRVCFLQSIKKQESEGSVVFEVFEKLTSACLSKFHEKQSYYVLIIYIKMFETIVVLTYGFCQADVRMCSHCLFPVVVTSLEQVVIILLQG